MTVYPYKYFVLDYNKKFNCTCRVKLFWADCITVLFDIIDCYSIIVKVNLKARGFTEFTRKPYCYITPNDFFVQLKRGETLGTLVQLRANQEDGKGEQRTNTAIHVLHPHRYQLGSRGKGFPDHQWLLLH